MKIWFTLCLTAVIFLTLASAKKNRKKAAPEWRSSSMPGQNKRFVTKQEGVDLKLDCKAQGHPKPNVQWLKQGTRIKSKNSPNMEARKYGLTLKNLSVDMSGNYTCVVKNKHGQLEWTFILEVQPQVWPLVVDGPHNITQLAGSDVVFTCRVLNDPRATIKWQQIQPEPTRASKLPVYDFLPDGDDPQMLRLTNIQKQDQGEYRCMAGNINGLKYSSAWLTVIEPVIIPDLPTGSSGIYNNNKDNKKDNNNNMGPHDNDNGLDLNSFDFGDRFYFTTTRRPRKNGGRRKNGRRKNKKNKNKQPKPKITKAPVKTSTFHTTTEPLESSSSSETSFDSSTTPMIWRYDNEPTYGGYPDNRYKPNEDFDDNDENNGSSDVSGAGNLGRTKKTDDEKDFEGNISAWKIYTIVGAVGGVILLIGLVAITIAVCCPKQEGGVYKSTPV